MMVRWYSIFLLLCVSSAVFAQGKIVLVGGGSETENGWSDEPYAWAVDQSQNKKVAVISYTDETTFIPNYFKSLGAVEADNIKLDSRAISDQQATYDLLMQYDVFFFKGGDQSFYYNYFKDTKTEQAIVDKFNNGGVMSGTSAGMAILSKVIFAALGSSLYPDDVLQNFKDPDITLRDDFLPFLPGFVVDSHLTERGRGARLMAFMANWYEATGEMLTGLGVDDRTAFCIDENNIGQVFGTGTVSVYSADHFGSFNSSKMISDSVHVTQLLYGNIIDLETLGIIEGPETPIIPQITSETGNYEVIMSGSEGLAGNQTMITYFVQQTGSATDSITVVTAAGKGATIIDRLKTLGAFVIKVETTEQSNDIEQIDLRNLIRKSKKVLFVENDDVPLFDFLQGGPTGTLIYNHIRRNEMITAFVGEDSRYAGKTFVTNHLTDALAAYNGRLNFNEGLNLLKTSTVISNTYSATSTDFYENTTAAVPYAMLSEELKYGIYLNRSSYLVFHQHEGKNFWRSTGTFTSIVAVSLGRPAGFATQPVSGSSVRDYVGFTGMRYVLLNGTEQLEAGIPQISNDEPYEPEELITATPEEEVFSVKIFPNPSENGIFHLRTSPTQFQSTMTVIDPLGKVLLQQRAENGIVDLSSFAHGIYYLKIGSDKKVITLKLIR